MTRTRGDSSVKRVRKRKTQTATSLPPPFEQLPDLTGLLFMIVEDDHETTKYYCSSIRECGGNAVAASDYHQWTKLIESCPNPDLLILDLELPGKSGIGILKEIEERKLLLRAVVVSGHVWEHAEELSRHGVTGVFSKPPSWAVLLNSFSWMARQGQFVCPEHNSDEIRALNDLAHHRLVAVRNEILRRNPNRRLLDLAKTIEELDSRYRRSKGFSWIAMTDFLRRTFIEAGPAVLVELLRGVFPR